MKRWLWSLLLLTLGCGDDATSLRGTSPVIGNLRFEPASLYVTDIPPEGILITGTFDFEDQDGDLAFFRMTSTGDTGPAGLDITLPLDAAAGMRQGTLQGQFLLPPAPVGEYGFEVWVEDSKENTSNVLTGAINVSVDDSASGWTARAEGGMGQLNSVARLGDAGFCAVGYGGAVLQSEDGLGWEPRAGGSLFDLFDVIWADGQLVAVGDGGAVFTSSDGIYWTDRSVSFPVTTLYCAAWSGADFVAVGTVGGLEPSQILTSPDGITWTLRPHLAGVSELRAVAWTGSRFVALGTCSDDSTAVTVSVDGQDWSPVRKLEPAYPRDMIWTGHQLVGVGGTGKVLLSADGVSWQVVQTPANGLNGVAWSGERLAAVGVGVFTSPDGLTWTQTHQTQSLRSLVWADIRYIGVGFAGTAMTSP